MSKPSRPVADIRSYHAHVYFDPATTRGQAEWLREQVAERFRVRLGRWHERRIGPHDQAMFQIAFLTGVFPTLVPWLMINHGDLSVLIHPNTDNARKDHLANALWIGERLRIHGEVLPEAEEVNLEMEPNTRPTLQP